MATPAELIRWIDRAVKDFDKAMPGVEVEVFKKIQEWIKDLEIKGGKITSTTNNIKLMMAIKAKLQRAIAAQKEYKDAVNNFLEMFDRIAKLQANYFSQFVIKYTPAKILPIIREMNIDATVSDLLGQGMNQGVVEPLMEILRQNITTGGSYADFNQQIRNDFLTGEAGPGRLIRWSRQLTVDAINQYAAQNSAAIAQDLNFQWGRYVGSLIETSREFCQYMVAKEYVHKSELPEVIKGKIDGHQCKLNKKSGLPLGMIPDTNAANFQIRRGGYFCGHQFFWLPSAAVPAKIKSALKLHEASPKVKKEPAKQSYQAYDETKSMSPEQLLKTPDTEKRMMDAFGDEDTIEFWIESNFAKTLNFKKNTYFRIEGLKLGSGVGEGMYVGRDAGALESFYNTEQNGYMRTFKGEPKWLDLADSTEYKRFEQEAIAKYGKHKDTNNELKKLTLELGFDGIRYYDPEATGEEFVLFNTKALKEVKETKVPKKVELPEETVITPQGEKITGVPTMVPIDDIIPSEAHSIDPDNMTAIGYLAGRTDKILPPIKDPAQYPAALLSSDGWLLDGNNRYASLNIGGFKFMKVIKVNKTYRQFYGSDPENEGALRWNDVN